MAAAVRRGGMTGCLTVRDRVTLLFSQSLEIKSDSSLINLSIIISGRLALGWQGHCGSPLCVL